MGFSWNLSHSSYSPVLCALIERKIEMDELKLCPICQENLVHPVGVYVRTVEREGDTSITSPCIHMITHKGYEKRFVCYEDSQPRGVVIIREYLGECGHRWIEREQFHKGCTLQEWQQLQSLVGPECVIWRD